MRHLQDLPLDEIKGYFSAIPGALVEKVKDFFTEGPGEKGIHFFKIEYDPGDVIMPRGVHSDYVALHLKGLVLAYDRDPDLPPVGPGCWGRRPILKRFLSWVLGRPPADGEKQLASPRDAGNVIGLAGFEPEHGQRISTRDPSGRELDPLDRFLGVAGALWNQPRSKTLVAGKDGDEKCVLLLIKRKALVVILPQRGRNAAALFYRNKSEDFLTRALPSRLAENQLFRPRLYVDDVREADWPRLLDLLQGAGGPERLRRVRARLGTPFRQQLAAIVPAQLDGGTRYFIIKGLNQALKGKDSAAVTLAEMEQAFPNLLHSSAAALPRTPADFRKFANCLRDLSEGTLLPVVHEKAKAEDPPIRVYEKNTPSDALYLILNGMFRVTRGAAGGGLLVNHLGRDGYFGESCIEEGAERASKVEAIALWNQVLRLKREVVVGLTREFPAFGDRLRREMSHMRARDAHRDAGRSVPPADPPREAVGKLLLARNLLLVDMDLCTRCDQCVRACAETHDGQPRFHRANPHADPPLRFGRWEVAAACVHCSDAPCLPACPTGAITLLERDRDEVHVHIHRSRCIGCSACSSKCPFHVIEMVPRTSVADGPNIAVKKYGDQIATKCDLCLTDKPAPPCVASCPYGAAHRGAPEAFFRDVKSWASLPGL